MAAQHESGDPIPDVFPPSDPASRFVVAMGMAKNDVERALRDVLTAAKNDRPDFAYRVRLSTGHLVEALDSLAAYSQEFEEVRALTARVPAEGQKKLAAARGTLQDVGADALRHARDNTFHYPSPKSNYTPSSDERLRDTLAAMSEHPADVHIDYDERHVTLTFADEVALALSMGKLAPERDEIARQLERTRDGAFAFLGWAEFVMLAYFEARGTDFGEPQITRKK
jgi:hypothetical protein